MQVVAGSNPVCRTILKKIKGRHLHKTRLKCTVNPVLRVLQFWSKRPYVIYSKFDNEDIELKNFLGYGFGRITHYESILEKLIKKGKEWL
jgi:hypothetical protein